MRAASTARTRLEPDERREQILRCAIELFGEHPYAAVSTTEIAAAAGVTRGLLHHYFGTKRELYVEVVREMLIVPRMVVPEDVGPGLDERIDACVTWLLDMVTGHGLTFVAVAGAEGVGDDPEIEQLLLRADDIAARRLLQLLGVDEDLLDTPRVGGLGRAYGAMVKGAIREWVREGSLSRADVHQLLRRTLRTIITELVREPGPAQAPPGP
ncbi:TetR/AcrR family transcriptional regulator [Ornithinimicrobium avium]|uniref:TetR/AcrR family transcriptional regulator n=1 Tax=Ornithinimicrobium avium TaxID=2283195 RepID=UPI00192DEA0B|nr:TetR/AcrR family transcriptional regulator [Ornithinimicrobium avium]